MENGAETPGRFEFSPAHGSVSRSLSEYQAILKLNPNPSCPAKPLQVAGPHSTTGPGKPLSGAQKSVYVHLSSVCAKTPVSALRSPSNSFPFSVFRVFRGSIRHSESPLTPAFIRLRHKIIFSSNSPTWSKSVQPSRTQSNQKRALATAILSRFRTPHSEFRAFSIQPNPTKSNQNFLEREFASNRPCFPPQHATRNTQYAVSQAHTPPCFTFCHIISHNVT
jgi:hypothetical protein